MGKLKNKDDFISHRLSLDSIRDFTSFKEHHTKRNQTPMVNADKQIFLTGDFDIVHRSPSQIAKVYNHS